MDNGVDENRYEGHRWALEALQAPAGDKNGESDHRGGHRRAVGEVVQEDRKADEANKAVDKVAQEDSAVGKIVQEDCMTGRERVLTGSQRGALREAAGEPQADKGRLKQKAPLGGPWDRWLWDRDEEGQAGGRGAAGSWPERKEEGKPAADFLKRQQVTQPGTLQSHLQLCPGCQD